MGQGQREALWLAVALGGAIATGSHSGVLRPAQAQNENQQQHKKQKPAPARPQPSPSPSFKALPPRVNAPPPAPRAFQKPPATQQPAFQKQPSPYVKPATPVQKTLPPSDKPAFKTFQQQPTAKPGEPRPPMPDRRPDIKKDAIKRWPPPGPQGGSPPTGAPGFQPSVPIAKPPTGPGGPAMGTPTPQPGQPWLKGADGPGPAPKGFKDVQKWRVERVEGDRKVIQEPGNRFIIKDKSRAVIRHDEGERFARLRNAKTERHPDGRIETYYTRSDGARVINVVDSNGRLLRRYCRYPDGRERNLIDNRRFYRNVGIGLGIGALGIVALNLALPDVTIPADKYIVDYDTASDDDLYEALDAPPIEPLERGYSLEEVRDSYELRARMRRIDVDTITFESGAWEVPPDQYDRLERMARAILRVLRDNPEAVFLIEGHTDAVGSEEDNLSLSDRRATAVADTLSDVFGVPAENLVTQGYGEQHLKIDTQEPEQRNRRVTVINITALMAER